MSADRIAFCEPVRFKAEPGLNHAVARAARQARTSSAEWMRQALRQRLTADDVALPDLDGGDGPRNPPAAPAMRQAAMQYVNIRHNRHDGTVAPVVSLGRSYLDRLPVPALVEPRTAAQIIADRDLAQAERESLEASWSDVLVNGSVEDLLALDTRIALAKAKQDQAAWSARNREAEGKAIQTRSAVEQTRRALNVPGSSFVVRQERYAADGSRWKRVA